jgi:HlyD family secretion protein
MTRAVLFYALSAALLAGCNAREDTGWLGYIEGEAALIAPPQPGWITSVAVTRGAQVHEGDALFTLDAAREIAGRQGAEATIAQARAATAQAQAQIAQTDAQRAEADATVTRTQRELQRQQELVRIGASPRRDLEVAQAAYQSAVAARRSVDAQRRQAEAQTGQAQAQIAAGEAGLATAQTNLAERTVHARTSGQVQEIYFRQGEYAPAGMPVVSLLAPDNVFVRFFIPEPALANVRIGDRVRVGCDGCPADLTATISFISAEAEFTPPIIYSVTNRQKLVFKAEARAPGLALRPGLPVDVTPLPR